MLVGRRCRAAQISVTVHDVTSEFHARVRNKANPPGALPIWPAPDSRGRIATFARNFPHRADDDENRPPEKFPCRDAILAKRSFQKPDPTLDGEFQIARCAKQMQMIGHEQVIADEPCGRRVFPDVVQSALHGCLCQPALTFLRANSEKNPVWSADGNVNPFAGVRRPGSRKGVSAMSNF